MMLPLPLSTLRSAASCALLLLAAPLAQAGTTTTTYTYNTDGALTAMAVTDAAGQTAQTLYTWDNFAPSASDAASGTVRLGDGNLLSAQTASGTASGTAASFAFDARGRLTGQTSGGTAQDYGYHVDSILRHSELGGETRSFYHAPGALPQTANIVETTGSESRTSARLGAGRYLSDGTEQSLFAPRKDMAGIYSDGAFEPRAYAPFGEPLTAPNAAPEAGAAETGGYDLSDPPEGYTGEYTDPAWGGVYLRARWYDPAMSQFVSRDPRPHLNRFAYGAGNPVMKSDPSGMTAQSHGRRHRAPWYERGIGGFFAKLFLMPIVGPMEIAAHPKSFWQSIVHDQNGIDIFLALGVATEGFSVFAEEFGMVDSIRTFDVNERIGIRRDIDNGIGVSQAVAAGFHRGAKHFDWAAFGSAITQSAGTLLYTHYVAGVGYHPFAENSDDILNLYRQMRQDGEDGAYVFRARTALGSAGDHSWGTMMSSSSPLTEQLNLGLYHESIWVVTKDGVYTNELGLADYNIVVGKEIHPTTYGAQVLTSKSQDSEVSEMLSKRGPTLRFQSAGHRNQISEAELMFNAPLGIIPHWNKMGPSESSFRYNKFTNNCQTYAAAVVKQMLQ